MESFGSQFLLLHDHGNGNDYEAKQKPCKNKIGRPNGHMIRSPANDESGQIEKKGWAENGKPTDRLPGHPGIKTKELDAHVVSRLIEKQNYLSLPVKMALWEESFYQIPRILDSLIGSG